VPFPTGHSLSTLVVREEEFAVNIQTVETGILPDHIFTKFSNTSSVLSMLLQEPRDAVLRTPRKQTHGVRHRNLSMLVTLRARQAGFQTVNCIYFEDGCILGCRIIQSTTHNHLFRESLLPPSSRRLIILSRMFLSLQEMPYSSNIYAISRPHVHSAVMQLVSQSKYKF
jgi:hypothetical protein